MPDVILHRRLENGPGANLLALEFKVRTDDDELRLHDETKLRVMRGLFPYAVPHPTRNLLIPPPHPLPPYPPNDACELPADTYPYAHAAMVLVTRHEQRVDWVY